MIYEQPLNEQIRVCLRLEYLFAQTSHYISGRSPWDSHQMLRLILDILQVIERIDLKNKFCQILNQYTHTLSQLKKLHNVDNEKLDTTLKQIERLVRHLHASQKKIGQELREDEFLTTMQQRLYTPAGTCGFSLPAYQLWLQQERPLRQQQILSWFKHFEQLQEIVDLVLKLMRGSTPFKAVCATGGFYQNNLDPTIPYQLIRIKLNATQNIFPEISLGRFRLAIHFFTLDITGRAAQTPDDVTFDLACCKM